MAGSASLQGSFSAHASKRHVGASNPSVTTVLGSPRRPCTGAARDTPVYPVAMLALRSSRTV